MRGDDVDEEDVSGVAAGRRCDACVGAGKDLRTEAVALGTGVASAAKGAGRLGRRGRKSIRRYDKYKVYPAQQLGKAFDHYDMARDGIADVTYVNPGYQPGRFPIIAAGELPFL